MANWRDKNSASLIEVIGSGAGISHTGNTTKTSLKTITFPAGTFQVGDSLRIQCLYNIDDGDGVGGAPAGTMTARVEWDGTTCCSIATIGFDLGIDKLIIVENSTTLTCQAASRNTDIKGTGASERITVDISAEITLEFTAQLTNGADAAYLRNYTVLHNKAQ